MSETPTSSEVRTNQFMRLYAGCERQLFGYLLAVTGSPADAEEVHQDASLVLWRRFDDFEEGTNFLAWAKQIAFYRLLAFRKRKGRIGLTGDQAFLESVEMAFASHSELLNTRLLALEGCMGKLTQSEQDLVAARYSSGQSIKQLAIDLKRPANTLYKALERIRHLLIKCVERTLAQEDHK